MRCSHPALWGVLLSTLWLVVAPITMAAPGTNRPTGSTLRDTLFTQIKLSREGVSAVDTGGNRWAYDFEAGSFVHDTEAPDASDLSRDNRSGSEANAGPVTERCVNQKIVKPLQKIVTVGYDEFVDGDIVAYGRVVVKGWVKGDVESLNGSVTVANSGQVDGDVKAPDIAVNKGGKIKGKQIKINPLNLSAELLSKEFSTNGLYVVLGFVVFLLVAAFLIVSLFPRQLANIGDCLFEHKVKSVAIGFLMLFVLPILVVITIIGIVILPLVPLAYVVAIALGTTALGERLGRRILVFTRVATPHTLLSAAVGVAAFMLLWVIVALLLGSGDSVANGFGIFALVVSILISLFPVCGGIGAALMTRLGYREYRGTIFRHRAKETEAPTPAPPPIPEVGNIVSPPPLNAPFRPLTPLSEGPVPIPPRPVNPDTKPPLPSAGA
jgi:hypothetical protein